MLRRGGPALSGPGPNSMIELTRLNGKPLSLNALYIETVEAFPDTTITLTTGRKVIVKESTAEVRKKVSDFYREIQVLSNPHLRGEEDE
ncbi:flagellar protein FlbD [Ureibacillus acetophenoni]|uniref:Flagellar protein FlbD n=2 Tax=Ureibacillus acetophenoni TaxID=614649 RepID=A0A285U132_9BACL|nr:flagellar protein FlbD [Ureibacillus acetophenoni]